MGTIEEVVLVDEQDQPIGTMPKAQVHGRNTPLHRGFSIFVFNNQGEVLLQQRSHSKKTWPLVWSNSCCGHPSLNEEPQKAAERRLSYELGININHEDIYNILPDYRYYAEKDGIVENEFCPVMIAFYDREVSPNPEEVEAVKWTGWEDFLEELQANKEYSPWCIEETQLLNQNQKFKELFSRSVN